LNFGALGAMEQDHVLATAATSMLVLRVDITILEQLMFKQVGPILFVLVEFIDAILERLAHVRVVLLM